MLALGGPEDPLADALALAPFYDEAAAVSGSSTHSRNRWPRLKVQVRLVQLRVETRRNIKCSESLGHIKARAVLGTKASSSSSKTAME